MPVSASELSRANRCACILRLKLSSPKILSTRRISASSSTPSEKSLPRTLLAVLNAMQNIGYTEVEATYDTLNQIWSALTATKLKPVSVHVDSKIFTGDSGSPRHYSQRNQAARLRIRCAALVSHGRGRRRWYQAYRGNDEQVRRACEGERPDLLLSQPRASIFSRSTERLPRFVDEAKHRRACLASKWIFSGSARPATIPLRC